MRIRALLFSILTLVFFSGAALAEPVNYKELLPLVNITVPGWTPGAPTGQTVKAPVEASEAVLEFKKGEQRLEVAIYDGGPAMGSAMAAVSQVEMESPDETVKPVTIKGFRGTLYLHTKENEADLVITVPARFAVSLHLDNGLDGELLKNTASQIDLAKLSALGK